MCGIVFDAIYGVKKLILFHGGDELFASIVHRYNPNLMVHHLLLMMNRNILHQLLLSHLHLQNQFLQQFQDHLHWVSNYHHTTLGTEDFLFCSTQIVEGPIRWLDSADPH